MKTGSHSDDPLRTEDQLNPKAIAADIARELRDDPKRWTQGVLSRSARGESLMHVTDCTRSPRAACWCLIGHIIRRTGSGRDYPVTSKFRAVLGTDELAMWNDKAGRSAQDIIDACDKVAAS